MLSKRPRLEKGFTIVELIIVIVVLGILALIVFVSYNGIQQRAQNNKIVADLTQLQKVIMLARISAGDKTLIQLTGRVYTASACEQAPINLEITEANRSANTYIDQCWIAYRYFLDQISAASGINVTTMTDPWGRPYWLDENEGEITYCGTARDTLSVMKHPRTAPTWAGSFDITKRIAIPNIRPGCTGT